MKEHKYRMYSENKENYNKNLSRQRRLIFCSRVAKPVRTTSTLEFTNGYMYTSEFFNRNQYGFIPQTNTIYAVMASNEFVQEGFSKRGNYSKSKLGFGRSV